MTSNGTVETHITSRAFELTVSLLRSLEITIGIPHNSNWQDWTARQNRKTVFHAAVNHYCRELGITWAHSPQPLLFAAPSQQPPLLEELAGDEPPPTPAASAPPRPSLFFVPPRPEDEANVGLRSRKTKRKVIRGNMDG